MNLLSVIVTRIKNGIVADVPQSLNYCEFLCPNRNCEFSGPNHCPQTRHMIDYQNASMTKAIDSEPK